MKDIIKILITFGIIVFLCIITEKGDFKSATNSIVIVLSIMTLSTSVSALITAFCLNGFKLNIALQKINRKCFSFSVVLGIIMPIIFLPINQILRVYSISLILSCLVFLVSSILYILIIKK